MVLLDAVTLVELFLNVFMSVYVLVVFLYILTSWFRLPYSLSPVQRFLYEVCEPYLRLWRRVLPSFGAARPLADGRHLRARRARRRSSSPCSTDFTREEER